MWWKARSWQWLCPEWWSPFPGLPSWYVEGIYRPGRECRSVALLLPVLFSIALYVEMINGFLICFTMFPISISHSQWRRIIFTIRTQFLLPKSVKPWKVQTWKRPELWLSPTSSFHDGETQVQIMTTIIWWQHWPLTFSEHLVWQAVRKVAFTG